MERQGHPRPQLQLVPEEVPEHGATEHWEAAYRETVVLIYRYIYARVGNRPDAEDLTTHVYMRALPRLRLRASIEEVRSYLVATARTVLADHWRQNYDIRVSELDDDVENPAPASSSAVDEEIGIRRAGEVLARLPAHYRRVLELRFLRGYSIRETAASMSVSVANAKVMQHRALKMAASGDLPE
jgi:RNA polymerase sigma-70 factor (ECF subfamily)